MMIKDCILIHYHEIGLKGNNKSWFEEILLKNIRKKLNKTPYTSIEKNASRIFVFGIETNKWEMYSKLLSEVVGIKNALLVKSTNADMDSINDISNSLISNFLYSCLIFLIILILPSSFSSSLIRISLFLL